MPDIPRTVPPHDTLAEIFESKAGTKFAEVDMRKVVSIAGSRTVWVSHMGGGSGERSSPQGSRCDRG